MSELKPCPFCGCKAEIKRIPVNTIQRYSVSCMVCDAALDKLFMNEEFAIDAWNRRADDGTEAD